MVHLVIVSQARLYIFSRMVQKQYGLQDQHLLCIFCSWVAGRPGNDGLDGAVGLPGTPGVPGTSAQEFV